MRLLLALAWLTGVIGLAVPPLLVLTFLILTLNMVMRTRAKVRFRQEAEEAHEEAVFKHYQRIRKGIA